MDSSANDAVGSPPKSQRWIVLAAGLLLLAVAALLAWFLLSPRKLDVWHRTTVPYSAACGSDCKTWRPIALAHGGRRAKTPAAASTLVYDPKVDDAIAQWGDCLQSILVCVRAHHRGDARAANQCVARAACPEACRQRYGDETGEDIAAAQKALFHVFVDKDAVCRPEQPG